MHGEAEVWRHGCPLHATQPKTNVAFWQTKIARNRARDRLVTRTLRRAGWRVLRIWDGARQRVDGRTKCGPEVQRKGERKRVPVGRARSQHELKGIPEAGGRRAGTTVASGRNGTAVAGGRLAEDGKRKIKPAARRNERRLLGRLRRAGLYQRRTLNF